MSEPFSRTPWALLDDTRLHPGDERVYCTLLRLTDFRTHLTRAGSTITVIATTARVSRTKVINAIARLVDAGWLVPHRGRSTEATRYEVQSSSKTAVQESCSPIPVPLQSNSRTTAVQKLHRKSAMKAGRARAESNPSDTSSDTSSEVQPSVVQIAPPVPVPDALLLFDQALRGAPGYAPTAEFFEHILTKYARLDLHEEAIVMAEWLTSAKARRLNRKANSAFVYGWLKRSAEKQPALYQNGTAKNYGYANGRPKVLAPTQPSREQVVAAAASPRSRGISDETLRTDPELQKRLGVIP